MLKSPKFRKVLGYLVAALLMYIVQFTPIMIPIDKVYFSPLLILTLCFSAHMPDLNSMIFGLFCGIAVDLNSLATPGFHAITYAIFALFVSLMCEFYFQRRMRTAVVLSIVPIICNSLLEWAVGTSLTENAWFLYTNYYLKSAVYTLVMFIPIYALFTVVFGFKNKNKTLKGVVPERLEIVRKKFGSRRRRKIRQRTAQKRKARTF